MKKAIPIIGILALTAVGLTGTAAAQGRGPRGGGPGKGMAALGLTDPQRQQIDQLRDAAARQAEPLQAQAKQKHDELRGLWRADSLDKGAIAQKQAELDALHVKQREIWTDLRYRVHAVLTPEQRAKWASAGPDMGRGFGRGFRHGGPDRGFGPGGGPGRGLGPGGCPGVADCPRWAK